MCVCVCGCVGEGVLEKSCTTICPTCVQTASSSKRAKNQNTSRDDQAMTASLTKVQHLLAPPWRLQCVRVRACVCVCVVVPQRTP